MAWNRAVTACIGRGARDSAVSSARQALAPKLAKMPGNNPVAPLVPKTRARSVSGSGWNG